MKPMLENLPELYTPLGVAADICGLRGRTAPPAGDSLDELLSKKRYAILFRQVATPNLEFERFVNLAGRAGLSPMVLEFHSDKFVSINPMKFALARLSFRNSAGGIMDKPDAHWQIADINGAEGKSLTSVRTKWGGSLIDFHRKLLRTEPQFDHVETVDASEWFALHGPNARRYYGALFSLFVHRAVLFETFLSTGRDRSFTSDIVIPSFKAAALRHGVNPLVCRLDPIDDEGSSHWNHYRGEYRARIENLCGAPGSSTTLSVEDVTPA